MFRPNKGKVLLKIKDQESKGGIILPDSATTLWTAEVIAVGVSESSLASIDGISVDNFSVGESVLIQKGAGTELEIKGNKYRLVTESSIYGTLV